MNINKKICKDCNHNNLCEFYGYDTCYKENERREPQQSGKFNKSNSKKSENCGFDKNSQLFKNLPSHRKSRLVGSPATGQSALFN